MTLRLSSAMLSPLPSLPHTPDSSSSPPLSVGSATNSAQNMLRAIYSTKKNRPLSSTPVYNTTMTGSASISIKSDGHGHLRAKPTLKTQLQLQPSYLNESAPYTSLIYPLHSRSGTHHAYMYIGSPPQRQTLIVDTGSRLTAFPCQPHCPDCGNHASGHFQLNASLSHSIVTCDECKLSQADFPLEQYFAGDGIGGSSGDGPSLRGAQNNKMNNRRQRNLLPNSCVNGQCTIDQRYTEGSSWKAFEVKDKVWLGSDDETLSLEQHEKFSTPFVFGCQVSENGLFRSQYADGIMGMSMYTQTLVGTWLEHKSISHNSFSLCFNRKGGHLSLGGIGSTYGSRPTEEKHNSSEGRLRTLMQFTPFAKEKVWYYTVTVTSISVGKHMLPKSILQYVNDHKGTIVDSGTTDTFISHKLGKPFTFAWEKITGRQYHNRAQQYTYEEFKELPVITFELQGGIRWEIRPEAYMEPSNNSDKASTIGPNSRWEGKRGFTSRVYVDEPYGAVLGSNAMMDKEIYFDIPNRRLGVAKATCMY